MSPSRYDEDSDEERLPEGMTRVGYDADTQTYTFRDADGSYWEGAPGCRYGRLTRVGQGPAAADDAEADVDDSAPFLSRPHDQGSGPSWRQDMMPFLNFGVLAGLFLLALFWFLYRSPATDDGSTSTETIHEVVTCPGPSLVVQPGDTCWALAEKRAISVEELESLNPWLDCERLPIGSLLCLPDYE
ncbi:hypothetical protein ESCO_001962 [Escovopsis weberi]|uniref:LysM domain-containing protein n=1 Tax=Escovopsis weberi TaxID=150374 RepID=A0A0M9VWI0_ESCWE|nr:hypothetical protein ESCO_001962 [Escovopsis weberi]